MKGDCESTGPVLLVHSKSIGVVEVRWLRDIVSASDSVVGKGEEVVCCTGCGGVSLLLINTCVPGQVPSCGLPALGLIRMTAVALVVVEKEEKGTNISTLALLFSRECAPLGAL